MGNFFKKIPTKKFDESIILFLKTKRASNVNEAIETINDCYPTSSTLNLDEYYDVFGSLLEDLTETVFLLLENDHNINGKVDIYESLAAIIVFCGEEFHLKLQYIFVIFDFDKSGEIEFKELVMTFQTSVRALCKMVHMKPASMNELEIFSHLLFQKLDTDSSKTISFKEFSEWMSDSWELQDFLLMYAMIQTKDNAERRTKQQLYFYIQIFESVTGSREVETADIQSIKTIFSKEMNHLDYENEQFLMQILESSTVEYMNSHGLEPVVDIIHKEPYIEVMTAWAAFDATDINFDNQVSIQELKYLIYSYEKDMPDFFRVTEEMQVLDKDNSGYVSRQEWILYLCHNAEQQGKSVFRGNLKKTFNAFDKDNSGSLNILELRQLLMDNLKSFVVKYKNSSNDEQEDFEGMVNSLADEILTDLNTDNDQNIEWSEFKNFMEKAYLKQEKLRNFLKTIS